jgi:Putative prokaryotic signal transducing protein
MKSIFRGSDYIQAQLLTGLLEQHGITVYLQGAALQGGLGELPAVGHLSIMVDEQDERAAKSLLTAYERGDLHIDESFREPTEGQ